jgi:hypothetical protein
MTHIHEKMDIRPILVCILLDAQKVLLQILDACHNLPHMKNEYR